MPTSNHPSPSPPAQRSAELIVAAALATAIGVASISVAAASPHAAVSGPRPGSLPPTDAILGWMLGADFPDLSPYAETWASTAFPNRCMLLSPLPCG